MVGLDDLVTLLEERLVLLDREALAVTRLRVGRAPARAVLVGPMGLCTRTRERNARSAQGEIEREKNLEIPRTNSNDFFHLYLARQRKSWFFTIVKLSQQAG